MISCKAIGSVFTKQKQKRKSLFLNYAKLFNGKSFIAVIECLGIDCVESIGVGRELRTDCGIRKWIKSLPKNRTQSKNLNKKQSENK